MLKSTLQRQEEKKPLYSTKIDQVAVCMFLTQQLWSYSIYRKAID